MGQLNSLMSPAPPSALAMPGPPPAHMPRLSAEFLEAFEEAGGRLYAESVGASEGVPYLQIFDPWAVAGEVPRLSRDLEEALS